MKFNIAYPATGAQKMYNVDDEHKWGKLVDRRMGAEFEGETLGDEFKGYVFKITGGADNDGFPMKQGILIKGRVRLILEPGKDSMNVYIRNENQKTRFYTAIFEYYTLNYWNIFLVIGLLENILFFFRCNIN